MTAYERGWIAFELGKTLSHNPYNTLQGEYIAWNNGWRDHRNALGLFRVTP